MTSGPTVVITGASAGVGRSTAHAFAGRGARIGLLARHPPALEETATEVRRLGGEAIVTPADVADAEAVERAADRVEEAFGPIDIWVNNAMATVFSRIADMRAEEVRRVTEVTYLGQVHGAMAALRRMLPRDQGTIVMVGSALAYRAIPLQAAYCAAKFAIRGFTDSLRTELIHDGSRVRVTMVQLPAINTPQFDWARSRFRQRPRPVGPIFQPEFAAEAIVQAAEQAPRELWVGLRNSATMIGTMALPGVLDRMVAESALSGQLGEDLLPEDHPDNLFVPVPGLHRTHGTFDQEARHDDRSVSDLTALRTALGLGISLVAGAALGLRALTRG